MINPLIAHARHARIDGGPGRAATAGKVSGAPGTEDCERRGGCSFQVRRSDRFTGRPAVCPPLLCRGRGRRKVAPPVLLVESRVDATVGPPECNGWPPLLCRLAYRFGRRRWHDDPTALAVPVHGLCVQNHDARRVRRLVPGIIYPARPMRRFRPEGDPPPVACREHRVAAGVADPQPAHATHRPARPARYPCCGRDRHADPERWRRNAASRA